MHGPSILRALGVQCYHRRRAADDAADPQRQARLAGCGAAVPAVQKGSCDRHIESYSRCLDELAPQQVLASVDEALVVKRFVG